MVCSAHVRFLCRFGVKGGCGFVRSLSGLDLPGVELWFSW